MRVEHSEGTEVCICEWRSVQEYYNVRTLIPQCEWSTASVQKSASVSIVQEYYNVRTSIP